MTSGPYVSSEKSKRNIGGFLLISYVVVATGALVLIGRAPKEYGEIIGIVILPAFLLGIIAFPISTLLLWNVKKTGWMRICSMLGGVLFALQIYACSMELAFYLGRK
jgi:hypothetical protein